MKRILTILVLLMAVSLVTMTTPVPTAYADESDSISVPDTPGKWGQVEVETYGATDGESTGGDPDSLGDGHSRTLDNTDPAAAGGVLDGIGGTELEECLLYLLSQIQLLAL